MTRATAEQQGLDDVYRRLGHLVLRRAEAILGRRDEAEDVLHDVFLRLAEKPAELAAAREPVALLYASTTHACLNRLRNRRTRTRILGAQVVAHATSSPEGEVRSELRQALEVLPPELQAVMIHYHLDRMTQAEIAEVIGCSRRTVCDLLARVRRYVPLPAEDAR